MLQMTKDDGMLPGYPPGTYDPNWLHGISTQARLTG